MREMKESVIPFLDQIPSNWEEIPIRYLFKEITAKNKLGKEKTALKFTYGTIIPKTDFDVETDDYVANTILNYTLVSKGVIMINCLNLNFDFVSQRVGLVRDNGAITSAYLAIKPNERVIPEFANYELKYFDSIKAFHNMGTGVRKTLDFAELGKKYFALPPLSEQRKIVDFLDTKCIEIDSLVTDIQSEIETLEAFKRSEISEVVTKGINKNVPMKDSGIEWVGTIPAMWDVHPVYVYFRERKNKNYALQEQNLLSLSYGKIIRKDIDTAGGLLPASFNTYNIVEVGDIIIRPTDLQNDKRSLRTGLVTEKGIITSAYIDLAPKGDINTAYFHYLLHSFDVQKVFYNMGNGVRQGLNYSEFSKLMIFAPPRNEQDDIVAFLNDKCFEIDAIIAQKKEQLDILAEYKKSLIYEYVTGKKEVPEP